MNKADRLLKFSGTVELTEGQADLLKYQKEYSIAVRGELAKIEDYNTQDEGSRKRYTIKISQCDFVDL